MSAELRESGVERRVVCAEECTCESGEQSVRTRFRDLSAKGAYLRTSDPFHVGARVHLKFQLAGELLEATGIVRHSQIGYGMGIEFLLISPSHQEILCTHVSQTLVRLGAAAYSRARRASRVAHRAKVKIQGSNAEGRFFQEETETLDVSDIGARIVLLNHVLAGELLALQVMSAHGNARAQFRVVWQGAPGTSTEGQTGLELMFVDLWGLSRLSRE